MLGATLALLPSYRVRAASSTSSTRRSARVMDRCWHVKAVPVPMSGGTCCCSGRSSAAAPAFSVSLLLLLLLLICCCFRCYSPLTLTPDHKRYNQTESDHGCYCSLDANIRGVLSKCDSPDPTPAPPAPAPPTPVPPPAPGGVAVFTSGLDGYHTFRIPSLVKHPMDPARLLCFCEGRRFSSADHDWNDIVVKTSEDAGMTWSAMRVRIAI